MRAEEKKKEKKIPVDPDKTLPTASAAAIVTFLDATWVPYWNGKAKKKLDDDKLKKAGLVSDAHLKKLDPFFFPLPKRIDPQELKDFTEPFVDDMKSLNDELKSATEAAIKAAKAAALKKKLAEQKRKAAEAKLKAEIEKKKAAKAKLEGDKKETKKAEAKAKEA